MTFLARMDCKYNPENIYSLILPVISNKWRFFNKKSSVYFKYCMISTTYAISNPVKMAENFSNERKQGSAVKTRLYCAEIFNNKKAGVRNHAPL